MQWILTNVAGLTPTGDEVDASARFLDEGGSRVAITAPAVYHDQPLGFLMQLTYGGNLGRQPDKAGG